MSAICPAYLPLFHLIDLTQITIIRVMSPYYLFYFKVKITYLALSNWKKETTLFSETPAWRHIPEDSTFHVIAMRISGCQWQALSRD